MAMCQLRRHLIQVLTIFLVGLISLENSKAADFLPPLRTQGRYIVDSKGSRVKFACTNWYGAHLKTFAQNGLSVRSAEEIAGSIFAMGFNCVRLSYSTEAYVQNPIVRSAYIAKLNSTTGRTFLDVFDEVVSVLTSHSLMVIVNNHNSKAGWCCSVTDGGGLWFSSDYPESAWLESLVGMAHRYRGNPLVVGYDLRNEVRTDLLAWAVPVWGDTAPIVSLMFGSLALFDWRGAVERAGAAVLKEAPDALIVVEVLNNAQMLCHYQLHEHPLRGLDGHVVWSAHDYPWIDDSIVWVWEICEAKTTSAEWVLSGLWRNVWLFLAKPFLLVNRSVMVLVGIGLCASSRCSTHPRWRKVIINALRLIVPLFALSLFAWIQLPVRVVDTYEKFKSSRDAAWGHLVLNRTGPLWLGEFGEERQSAWWEWMLRYLRERDLDFAYWSVDGEKFPRVSTQYGEAVSGHAQEETYGLLKSDFQMVRHDWKLRDLQSLMIPGAARLPAPSPLRSSPREQSDL